MEAFRLIYSIDGAGFEIPIPKDFAVRVISEYLKSRFTDQDISYKAFPVIFEATNGTIIEIDSADKDGVVEMLKNLDDIVLRALNLYSDKKNERDRK